MILQSEAIKVKLMARWPELTFIWPTNPNWTLVADKWLPKITENCSTRHFAFIHGIWECENYARGFVANAYKYQYELYQTGGFTPEWRWAIGYSTGIKSDMFGNAIVHGMVIIITETEVLVYEPQEDTWLDNNYSYIPFFITF